ncbi:hypothetical protein [uncultured Winogradskyella sp.]|uniref:hypothetical protein n=1 Tax=uncultured Winogradskyella sp. TaxID=395353 RepID=UPI002612FF1D|nr:hypothetical protein [uncultured Winogradskyella sp.]
MKIKLLVFVFLFQSLNAFACLSAKQQKLFPVGVIDDSIIFIEVHLYRTHDIDKNDKSKNMMAMKWKVKSYVSIYNKFHKLISQTEIESSEIKGRSYLPLLQSTYTKGLAQIKSIYKSLDYFKAEYLSFCDYQKKCKRLEIHHDSITKKDTFKYKKQDFTIELSDNQKDEKSETFVGHLSSYFLNSVRIYKTKDIELIIGHIATGHEVSMGWITDNPNKKPNKFGDPIHKAEPYHPDFEFKELRTAVYEEPIMHHGYGFDLFIIK